MAEISEIGAVQHLTKAFAMYLTEEAYAALPDRHGVSVPVADQKYRDSEHPSLVFVCRGSATDWHRYWWESYSWRGPTNA